MAHYEKPKGQPKRDDDFSVILREFYWRLFVQLMIPALALGFIFWLPTAIVGNLPDRLNAQCTTFDDNTGILIVSETQQINSTDYYWTNDSGVTWQYLFTVEADYQSARADCTAVIFAGDITQISTLNGTVRIDEEGIVLRE